jgi:hypothetical protein
MGGPFINGASPFNIYYCDLLLSCCCMLIDTCVATAEDRIWKHLYWKIHTYGDLAWHNVRQWQSVWRGY